MTKQQTRWSQFGVLITVFFFWGFVAASNDILIPVFKKAFNLTQVESQWVSNAFYIAYAVGSALYFLYSKISGADLLNRIGYKNGICLGLVISALGTLLFIPAANLGSFPLMLSGLFVVALGFSLQQIAANPLAIVMGDPSTGAQRLNMAGGVNNFGTTIGPLLVSYAIFGSATASNATANIGNVKTPYLFLGAAFLIVAAILKFSSVPNKLDLDKVAAEEAEDASKLIHRSSVFAYPQLVLGMLAIFLYVGVEVSTAGNLPAYLEHNLNIQTSQVAPFISLFWASLMMGRWTGIPGVLGAKGGLQKALILLFPFLAFGVYLAVNAIAQRDTSQFHLYVIPIAIMAVTALASHGNPARMLRYFAVLGLVALAVGMLTSGMLSALAFVCGGLACSVMWPCIFTLAITGLGRHTGTGSSFLIMMIMGGGLVSMFQGWLSEHIGIQLSYLVGFGCFAYLAFYSWFAAKQIKAQGIDLEKVATGGGGH
ncbi:MAG: MFS transporter [Proteobacteria bacterium]|nr:MFS transporter [Pseudomonadota bacterium]